MLLELELLLELLELELLELELELELELVSSSEEKSSSWPIRASCWPAHTGASFRPKKSDNSMVRKERSRFISNARSALQLSRVENAGQPWLLLHDQPRVAAVKIVV